MPGIIDLQTNLRDLPYSTDSKQPYIRTRLPAYGDPGPSVGLLGRDLIGRSGQIQASLTDVNRLTKWGFDGIGGVLFLLKETALARTAPKTFGGPRRIYSPLNTIAQIAVGANSGIHLNKQGLLPIVDKEDTYEFVVRNEFNGNDGGLNRLTTLRKVKLLGESISITDSNLVDVNRTDETVLLQYGGGPNSILGIGPTRIKRYEFTEEWAKNLSSQPLKKQIIALTYSQLENETTLTNLEGTGLPTIGNFMRTLNDISTASPDTKKRILGRITNYTDFNRAKTYGAGDPGNSPNLDRQAYTEGTPTETNGVDQINNKVLYNSSNVDFSKSSRDIVKFYIAVLNNDNPQNKTYIHFRAYIQAFTDNYSATWDNFKYMGRGENFYKYQGFDRSISLGFSVYVHSRIELFPTYDKLNFLASSMTPDYSSGGFMRGNIVQLTVGDYLNDTYGIIDNLTYDISQDSPWEVAKKDDGNDDGETAELPLLINCTMNFKPIHNFVPRIVGNGNPYGNTNDSRFISLGSEGKGYKKVLNRY